MDGRTVMSDGDDLGTFDLDSTFDRFAADVDARTRARGAERAIRSARRRRVAAAAGALAACTVLAGVLIGTLGLPSHQPAPPVAAPAQHTLPTPATFDANAFNEAADGWIGGWTEGPSPVSTEMPCVPYDGSLPEPLDSSTTEFRAGPGIGATYKVERFDTAERAGDSLVRQTYGETCQGELFELPDEIWSGGQSVVYGVKIGRQSFYEILVAHDTDLAVLQVAGADVGELAEDARKRIVLALLADLRT